MLKHSVVLLCFLAVFVRQTLADDSPPNYLKVLIREIDNPGGTLLNGQPCSDFDFLGLGCSTYLSAGVSLDSEVIQTLDASQPLNPHLQNKITDLNIIVEDTEAMFENSFNGFYVTIVLGIDAQSTKPDEQSENTIAKFTFNVNSTDMKGVYTYTYFRDGTLPITISIAWATNISPATAATTSIPTSTVEFTGSTLAPTTTPKLPIDCDEIVNVTSGVNTIYPDGVTPVQVYCESKSYGAYTTIQSRGLSGANVDFNVLFSNYSDWFGVPGKGSNFWIGLDNMNTLSSAKTYALQIDLCCGTTLVAKQIYHGFKVGTKATNYTLSATADIPNIGLDYKSTMKDIGAQFATKDTYSLPSNKDECDEFEYSDDNGNEPTPYGGWWYGSCGNNLNGALLSAAQIDGTTCALKTFATNKQLGINLRTTSGGGADGYDVDLVSYDRVRMSIFTFDPINVEKTDASYCSN